MSWTRIRYRVAQFVRGIGAWFWPADQTYVAVRLRASGVLGPNAVSPDSLLMLFNSMKRPDQHHGVEIARMLEGEGFSDAALLAAALLHDVGKTRAPVGLVTRVWVVLGEHFVPALANRWSVWAEGQPLPRGLRRGFVVRRYHAAWGAQMVASVGAVPRVTDLIRRHHEPAGLDEQLIALQRVDEGESLGCASEPIW